MPSKNEVKKYYQNGTYHVYTRGVNKDIIFIDKADYVYFLYLLKRYLTKPIPEEPQFVKNYSKAIKLLAFCLMPNHIHLLLKQTCKTGMPEFMQSLLVSYSMHFNKKYRRVGPVFQSRYKARRIKNQSDLAYVSKYIHLNPQEIVSDIYAYKFSSLGCYIHSRKRYKYIARREILSNFGHNNDLYKKYIAGLT